MTTSYDFPDPDKDSNSMPPESNSPPHEAEDKYASSYVPSDRTSLMGLTDDERIVSALAHFGGIFLSWIVPLAIYLLYPAEKSRFVNDHSKEALNFQITLFIGYAISGILMFVLVGFVTWALLWIYAIIAGIMATLAANRGEPYRYGFAIRLLK